MLPAKRRRASRAEPPWGFLEYVVDEMWALAEIVEVPVAWDPTSLDASRLLRMACAGAPLRDTDGNVQQLIARKFPQTVLSVLTLPYALAMRARADAPLLVRSIPLTKRSDMTAMVPNCPKQSLLKRWRTLADGPVPDPAGDQSVEAARAEIECELPSVKLRTLTDDPDSDEWHFADAFKSKDPIMLLKSLRFSHLLRNTRDFPRV